MKILWVFLLLFACFVPVLMVGGSPVPPDEEGVVTFGPTGTRLLEWCSDMGRLKEGDKVTTDQLVDAARNVGSCVGFVAGVNDTALFYGSSIHPKTTRFSAPPGVKMDQLVRIVRKWLEDNPSQLHLPSSILVVNALSDAFRANDRRQAATMLGWSAIWDKDSRIISPWRVSAVAIMRNYRKNTC